MVSYCKMLGCKDTTESGIEKAVKNEETHNVQKLDVLLETLRHETVSWLFSCLFNVGILTLYIYLFFFKFN